MNMPVITVKNLSVGYGGKTVVSGINMELYGGEFTVLMGPNGSGKSTLLRTLSGLQSPLAGRIDLKGQRLDLISSSRRAQSMAVVLSERIRPWGLSVIEIIRMGRFAIGENEDICIDSLKSVGAESLIMRNASELSDGELQKVQIARALAQEPEILLLDEPTSFLDLPRRRDMVTNLKKLAVRKNISMVVSLHDLDLATTFADSCVLLDSMTNFQKGIPEDLAISGLLARSYGQLSDWDPLSPCHGPQTDVGGFSVRLMGEGISALWTARAFKRVGVAVDEDSSKIVEIISQDQNFLWRFSGKGIETEVFEDLESLLKKII